MLVSPGYDPALGVAGDLYLYLGGNGTTVDLASANYKDTTTWTDLATVTAAHTSQGSGGPTNSQQLNHGDIIQVSTGYDPQLGIVGHLYAYKGTSGTTLDLAGADYLDPTAWSDLDLPTYISQGTGVASNSQQLTKGDIVHVLQGYNSLKGKAGDLYQFLGTSGGTFNLAVANYNDTINWADIGPAALKFDTTLDDLAAKLQPLSANALVKVVEGHASGKGIIGDVYQYVGNSGLPVDLAGADYTDPSQWRDMSTHLDTSSIGVKARDGSQIAAIAGAAAVSASFAGVGAVSVSIGISQAKNTIDGDVAAYIKGMASVSTGGDNVNVSATDAATIKALSAAAAISVAIGGAAGVSMAGGGATADNEIGVKTNAYIQDSTIGNGASQVGRGYDQLDPDASVIVADVGAVAVAAAGGGAAGSGSRSGRRSRTTPSTPASGRSSTIQRCPPALSTASRRSPPETRCWWRPAMIRTRDGRPPLSL